MVALADGRRAPSASRDHTLKIWDLETGVLLRTLEGHTEMVYGVAALPDPRRAISCSEDRTLKLWDLETGVVLRTLEGHTELVYGIAALPDGRSAISCSEDRTVKLWDLANGRCVATWTADEPVRCVAAASDRLFMAGDEGGTLHFLDLAEPLPSSAERV